MTLQEIKEQVMFQTNNDADDLGDFEPHMDDYVNEGYDLLVEAVYGTRLGEKYAPLAGNAAEPSLPAWMHRGLVDYATWLVYRNGNVTKQNRGMAYRAAFESLLSKARLWAANQANGVKDIYDRDVAPGRFYNIYP